MDEEAGALKVVMTKTLSKDADSVSIWKEAAAKKP
jgi:hypothetical protein